MGSLSRPGDGMAMDILLVVPDPHGGIYHYTYELCKALASQDVSVTLATSKGHEFANSERRFSIVEVFDLRRSGFLARPLARRLGIRKAVNAALYARSLVKLALYCRTAQPAIVHLEMVLGSVMTLVTVLALRIAYDGVLINTVHNLAPRARYPGHRLVCRVTLAVLDHVVVHSGFGAKRLMEVYQVPAEKISRIPHGNYNVFVPEKGKHRSLRDALNITQSATVVLFFGFIKPYKGLVDLLYAIKAVAEQGKEVVLLIAGQARKDYWKYRAIMSELGIEAIVREVLDYIPFEDVGSYFETADVIVLPYRDATAVDQSGVAQLAYAFGKPLVVTDVGGLPEIVVNGETGFSVPRSDIGALAERIGVFCDDRRLAQEMGRKGKELATSEFGWPAIAARHLGMYERALSSWCRRRCSQLGAHVATRKVRTGSGNRGAGEEAKDELL